MRYCERQWPVLAVDVMVRLRGLAGIRFLSTFLLSFPLPSSFNTPFCKLSSLLTSRFSLGLHTQVEGRSSRDLPLHTWSLEGGLDAIVTHLLCLLSWPGTEMAFPSKAG